MSKQNYSFWIIKDFIPLIYDVIYEPHLLCNYRFELMFVPF